MTDLHNFINLRDLFERLKNLWIKLKNVIILETNLTLYSINYISLSTMSFSCTLLIT